MRLMITSEKYSSTHGEYWVNNYYAEGTDWTSLATEVAAIVAAERPVHLPFVQLTKVRVSDLVQGNNNYATYVQNLLGTAPNPAGDSVPLWVTARVDFTTVGGGSPSRKYLRGCMQEADMTFNSLTAAQLARLQTYGNAIIAIPALCDVDGALFSAASPFNSPQMRQLRRGSKRPDTP